MEPPALVSMAQTFVLIAQEPLDFKGQHYEPGDRIVATPFESAPLQRHKLTIEATQEEQRAHDAQGSTAPPRRPRGRPRKTPVISESVITEPVITEADE